jgi:hypothetical protein
VQVGKLSSLRCSENSLFERRTDAGHLIEPVTHQMVLELSHQRGSALRLNRAKLCLAPANGSLQFIDLVLQASMRLL